MKPFLLITALMLWCGGCAATKEQVTSSLQDRFTGQKLDVLVAEFGPPVNSFKMPNGGASYEWNIANHTNVYQGAENTLYCKIRCMTDAANVVTTVSTEDAANGFGESLCAERLKLARKF